MVINSGNENDKQVYFWLKNFLVTLMVMLVQLQSSHFLHKIHSNALLLEEEVLSGNGNL